MSHGYAHPRYAQSLSEFATPRLLPRSGAWILERTIDGTSQRDAMGCYPLFACSNWSGLEADLNDLQDELVCLSLVTDPFGEYEAGDLEACFPHKVVPFKKHFVADLASPFIESVSKHHRYYAQRALGNLEVEVCDEPSRFLDTWCKLYSHLSARHGLKGMKAFSRKAFEQQLTVPGIRMLRAIHQGETVGAHLWYQQGDVVHSHLAAVNARGYELMASYALYWSALESFSKIARWLNFGAGAGLDKNDDDGLTRFKRGWATTTRTAYFCARILETQKYESLCAARGVSADTNYFPAYRQGEFA